MLRSYELSLPKILRVMRLSELKTGEKGVIVKVLGHAGFRKRIVEMGFIKGKTVEVLLNAPLKDPIKYKVLGYEISLRRQEAEMIEVVSEEEAIKLAEETIYHEGLPEDISVKEEEMKRFALGKRRTINVALVGNPNSGKTSLFNLASGAHEHVGNYSGVTVDAKEGEFVYGGYRFILVDLPGTYSLSAYSPEELYVRKNLVENIPDVVVNVVDASNLERNLYLTTQLIDMNLRMVMALNMFDELIGRGDDLDIKTLGHLLGMPVVPTVSRSGKGIGELFDTVIRVYEHNDPQLARHIHINHGADMEDSIERIKLLLQRNSSLRYKYSTRYLAIKYFENDSEVEKIVDSLPGRDEIIAARYDEQKRIESLLQTSTESAIVDAKYAFISGALKETWKPAVHSRKRRRKPFRSLNRVDLQGHAVQGAQGGKCGAESKM